MRSLFSLAREDTSCGFAKAGLPWLIACASAAGAIRIESDIDVAMPIATIIKVITTAVLLSAFFTRLSFPRY
jgi:hypothetical protein